MNRKKIIIGILLSVLSACTTLTKEECLKGNWKTIGFTDGAQGYPIDRLGKHQKACADFGVSPHLATYQAGYQEGLKSYCVAETAFELGKQAQSYNGVCPQELEKPFMQHYLRGLKSARTRVEEEIAQQEQVLDEQHNVLIYLNQETELKEMQTQLQSTRKEIEQLRNKKIKIIQLIEQVQGML